MGASRRICQSCGLLSQGAGPQQQCTDGKMFHEGRKLLKVYLAFPTYGILGHFGCIQCTGRREMEKSWKWKEVSAGNSFGK